jgi:hypothetical protein
MLRFAPDARFVDINISRRQLDCAELVQAKILADRDGLSRVRPTSAPGRWMSGSLD